MPVLFAPLAAAVLIAQGTTTTAVPRVVGEPLATSTVLLASFALLVVILVAGFVARRHLQKKEAAKKP